MKMSECITPYVLTRTEAGFVVCWALKVRRALWCFPASHLRAWTDTVDPSKREIIPPTRLEIEYFRGVVHGLPGDFDVSDDMPLCPECHGGDDEECPQCGGLGVIIPWLQ